MSQREFLQREPPLSAETALLHLLAVIAATLLLGVGCGACEEASELREALTAHAARDRLRARRDRFPAGRFRASSERASADPLSDRIILWVGTAPTAAKRLCADKSPKMTVRKQWYSDSRL